jgi:CheY-like chemotaxis protein
MTVMTENARVYLCVLEDDPTWSLPIIQAIKTHLPHVTIKLQTDGKSFLRRLSDEPAPDLLILDINTPVLSGLEVLKIVRARDDLKWLPVIMYSTDNSDETRITAMQLGANGFVGKVSKDVASAFKEIINKYSYKGEKPDRIEPPLLKESTPSFSNWDALDSMLEDL